MQMSRIYGTIDSHYQRLFFIFLLTLFFSSCKNGRVEDQFLSIEKKQIIPSGIIIDYPIKGTVFPPEFQAPQFLWTDTIIGSGRWYIRILNSNGQELCNGITDTLAWRPDPVLWENI